MELDRKELKARAREAMALPRPKFWVVTLVYLLVTTGFSTMVSMISAATVSPATSFSGIGFFLVILTSLFTVVVDFGYTLWSLWAVRRLDPGLGSLIQGFSVAGRVIWMEILIGIKCFLWCVPIGFGFLCLVLMMPAAYAPAFLLLYLAVWAIMLRYALAPYLLADRPDDGAEAAVRRSVELMRGWTWELLKLELSFMGWVLLSFALSAAATALILWQNGFFQLLSAFPAGQLPELVSGYQLWQNGLELEGITIVRQQVELYSLYASVSNSLWTVLLSNLFVLPLSLWLLPYRSVTRAGFYEARLQAEQERIPPMPPL